VRSDKKRSVTRLYFSKNIAEEISFVIAVYSCNDFQPFAASPHTFRLNSFLFIVEYFKVVNAQCLIFPFGDSRTTAN
jgi:hypothetical protein